MKTVDVWRNLQHRLQVFTKETAHSIPEAPGVYAWFLPLWLLTDDLSELLGIVGTIQGFEPKPTVESIAEFNWSRLSLGITQEPKVGLPGESPIFEQWSEVVSGPQRKIFEECLMVSSIFARPLYVGKADHLLTRYLQHVEGRDKERNFHSRFVEWTASLGERRIEVSDLLFACIRTDQSDNRILQKKGLNVLLERVIMQLTRPVFSIR